MSSSYSWAGAAVSYAGNGYQDYVGTSWPYVQCGPLTPVDSSHKAMSLATVTNPVGTILVSEKFSADLQKNDPTSYNAVRWTPSNLFISNNSINWYDGQGGRIPDGTGSSSAAYPKGINGGVSANHLETANFLFCDGHVKSMKPVATNPDGAGQPQNNMWNAVR